MWSEPLRLVFTSLFALPLPRQAGAGWAELTIACDHHFRYPRILIFREAVVSRAVIQS